MNPEKRYQVFISSTFRDLVDERQAVLKAVLELDHMPAGMELFPATDTVLGNSSRFIIFSARRGLMTHGVAASTLGIGKASRQNKLYLFTG